MNTASASSPSSSRIGPRNAALRELADALRPSPLVGGGGGQVRPGNGRGAGLGFVPALHGSAQTAIVHVPRVLYHWRMLETSTAAMQTQNRIVFERQLGRGDSPPGANGTKNASAEFLIRSPARALAGKRRKSIRGHPDPKQSPSHMTCIESLCVRTRYPHYEIVIVDNDSTDRERFSSMIRSYRRGCTMCRLFLSINPSTTPLRTIWARATPQVTCCFS
jgi:hypothetical protein